MRTKIPRSSSPTSRASTEGALALIKIIDLHRRDRVWLSRATPCAHCKAPAGEPCRRPDGSLYVEAGTPSDPGEERWHAPRLDAYVVTFNGAPTCAWRDDLLQHHEPAARVLEEIQRSRLYRIMRAAGRLDLDSAPRTSAAQRDIRPQKPPLAPDVPTVLPSGRVDLGTLLPEDREALRDPAFARASILVSDDREDAYQILQRRFDVVRSIADWIAADPALRGRWLDELTRPRDGLLVVRIVTSGAAVLSVEPAIADGPCGAPPSSPKGAA